MSAPFTSWTWAEWTRTAALAVGLYGTFLAESTDKPTVLSFAAMLLMAPNVAGAQRNRNEKREEET